MHRVTVNDIDPYANLSIGVSVVNNAGLESDLVETFYVGSESALELIGAIFFQLEVILVNLLCHLIFKS